MKTLEVLGRVDSSLAGALPGMPKDEHDLWSARVYLRLVFADLALLFRYAEGRRLLLVKR